MRKTMHDVDGLSKKRIKQTGKFSVESSTELTLLLHVAVSAFLQ